MTDLYLCPPCDPCLLGVPYISPADRRRRFGEILVLVEGVTGIDGSSLLSHQRPAWLCRARQLLYWALHDFTEASLPQIGRYLNRDHTTVLYGIRRARERMETDAMFHRQAERVTAALRGEL